MAPRDGRKAKGQKPATVEALRDAYGWRDSDAEDIVVCTSSKQRKTDSAEETTANPPNHGARQPTPHALGAARRQAPSTSEDSTPLVSTEKQAPAPGGRSTPAAVNPFQPSDSDGEKPAGAAHAHRPVLSRREARKKAKAKERPSPLAAGDNAVRRKPARCAVPLEDGVAADPRRRGKQSPERDEPPAMLHAGYTAAFPSPIGLKRVQSVEPSQPFDSATEHTRAIGSILGRGLDLAFEVSVDPLEFCAAADGDGACRNMAEDEESDRGLKRARAGEEQPAVRQGAKPTENSGKRSRKKRNARCPDARAAAATCSSSDDDDDDDDGELVLLLTSVLLDGRPASRPNRRKTDYHPASPLRKNSDVEQEVVRKPLFTSDFNLLSEAASTGFPHFEEEEEEAAAEGGGAALRPKSSSRRRKKQEPPPAAAPQQQQQQPAGCNPEWAVTYSGEPPVLIVAVGIPGSGKSSWAGAHVREANRGLGAGEKGFFVLVSADAVRFEITGSLEKSCIESFVWNVVRDRMLAALAAGRSVVLDATNTISKHRRSLLASLPPCQAFAKVFTISVPVAQSRIAADVANGVLRANVPLAALTKMNDQLTRDLPALTADGFRLLT